MIAIEKYKTYECHDYHFKNFIQLTREEKIVVLNWRNSPDVRKWMYNRDEIDLESHLNFIKGLKERDDKYYWLVFDNMNQPIGVFNVVNIDKENDIAETGTYAKPKNFLDSFNFAKEYLYFYFEVLGFTNMYSVSDAQNENILMYTRFWGIEYNRTITEKNNDEVITYNVCDRYTREDYKKNANQTIRDFIKYIRTNKS
jgi:hypothetical protein